MTVQVFPVKVLRTNIAFNMNENPTMPSNHHSIDSNTGYLSERESATELHSLAPSTLDGSHIAFSSNVDRDAESLDTELQGFIPKASHPKQPELSPLHNSSGWHLLLPELLNMAFAALFWVLAIAIVSLKDKTESPWATKVIEATKIAPSLWPVLFAVILGNAIKCYARWRAENGIALGPLEQLLNSQTLGSTVGNAFVLRTSGISTTTCLLLLWTFNPLGSQASFRAISLGNKQGNGARNLSYSDPSVFLDMNYLMNQYPGAQVLDAARVAYATAFASSDSGTQYVARDSSSFSELLRKLGGQNSVAKSTAMDPWGNIRIPNLRQLPGWDATDPQRWVDVLAENVTNYSSLVGVPVGGIPTGSDENFTYVIASKYHYFECSPWSSILPTAQWNLPPIVTGSTDRQSFIKADNTSKVTSEMTMWMESHYSLLQLNYNSSLISQGESSSVKYHRPLASLFRESSFFLDTTMPSYMWGTKPPARSAQRKILFASWGNTTIDITTCAVGVHYVNVNVSCEISGLKGGKNQCGVKRMQQMAQPPISINFTALENLSVLASLPTILFGGGLRSTMTEMYLANPEFIYRTNDSAVQLSQVPIEVFQDRFGLLMNTLFLSARFAMALVGRQELAPAQNINITIPTVKQMEKVYVIDWAWITVFMLGNLVLLVAAIAAVVYKIRCRSPDIFGYASSLARDSTYFPGEDTTGSTMDGPAKTRQMKRLIVRVGDVKIGEDVGKIAFAPITASGPIKRQRLYE